MISLETKNISNFIKKNRDLFNFDFKGFFKSNWIKYFVQAIIKSIKFLNAFSYKLIQKILDFALIVAIICHQNSTK